MSTKKINLSLYKPETIANSEKFIVGIVVSEWNSEVTSCLLEGATKTLLDHGVKKQNIIVEWVPGSFELPIAAQLLIERTDIDSVICLGCVIQGETRHFDFICSAVSESIMDVSLTFTLPVIFGVLTTNSQDQALERAGGKHGNKGVEAAVAALKMMHLQDKYSE
ncbi:MAG: 6,7-dimethyl-8-ribityllumazine synthase [Bacteroidota bacterium]